MPDGTVLAARAAAAAARPRAHARRKEAPQTHFEQHAARRRAILAEHPEVARLFGTEWRTQFYAYATIAAQLALAWLSRASFARAVVLGLTLGPYVNAAALSFMHEATHMLVFRAPAANRLLSIATNIAMVVPVSEIFRQHHHAHHRGLGDEAFDVDVPTAYEVRLVGNSTLRKAVWLMFNMIILPARSMSRLPVRVDWYLVVNWLACIGFGLSVLALSRPAALFLVLALLNSQGLHPANTRQVQRHVFDGDDRMRAADRPATYSYYGPANAWTLNVGYHVEHHDFARIPWTRLPELRRIAGDKWYPDTRAHRGRGLRELLNFVCNRDISLADFAR